MRFKQEQFYDHSFDEEEARHVLRQLALEHRSISLALVDCIDSERCRRILSQFAVWLLDTSIETLRFDWQLELHAKLREMHERRIHGEPIDVELWNSLNADALAGSKLWPPEWLCATCLPGAPPIARTASAIAIAQRRFDRESGQKELRIDYLKVQAEKLQSLLSSQC